MSTSALWLPAAYALLVFSSLKDVSNPDIFWHLSAGVRILAERRVPGADWLSFTRAGAPWVDFEWLSQVLFAGVHGVAGWWGLILLKVLLLVAAAALVERHLARRGLSAGARACGVLALTGAWAIVNDLRPDWISVLLLCGELSWLEGGARRFSWKAAAGAAALGALWANAHGGFVLGLAVAVVYAALGRAPWGLVAAGLAGTCLTPYGAAPYAVVFSHLRDGGALSRYIVEWRAASPLHLLSLPLWALLAGWLAAAAKGKPGPEELPAWIVVAALGAMALRHERHVALFAAAAVLLAPAALARTPREALDGSAPLFALATAVLLLLPPQGLSRAGVALGEQPVLAAAWLRAHPDVACRRLFNPWGWGGYLGWAVGGPYKVYYDGRYLFHDLLGPSIEASKSGPDWNRFLDEQKLDGALLDRRTRTVRLTYQDEKGAIRERVVPEAVALMPPDRWKLVYSDPVALLYLRQ